MEKEETPKRSLESEVYSWEVKSFSLSEFWDALPEKW